MLNLAVLFLVLLRDEKIVKSYLNYCSIIFLEGFFWSYFLTKYENEFFQYCFHKIRPDIYYIKLRDDSNIT